MESTAFDKIMSDSIYPDGIENHYWSRSRSNIIYNKIKKYGLTKNKFLEIGCNKGQVVDFLIKKRINIIGVDIADIDPYESVKNYVETNTDAFELSPEKKEEFDGILLLDVLEHLERPEIFLEKIGENFKNVKNIIATVPAMMSIWSNYDVYNKHFKRYHIDEIYLFDGKGRFKINDAEYLFHSLYLASKFLLKIRNDRSTNIISPKGLIAKSIHAAIASILLVEYHILPGSMPGSSIIFYMKR